MTTDYENHKFGEEFLEQIVDWIAEWFSIDEIFDKRDIEVWLKDNAKDYGYVMEE